MTKISYCLQVHKNPKQVGRLIKNIYSAEDFYYVNVFGTKLPADIWQKEFKEFENGNFFTSFRFGGAWGMFPVVNATLNSMEKFSCFDYDYFINLTGSCYPLKSVDTIKKFLKGSKLAYMEEFKLPSEAPKDWGKRGGLDRIRVSYYRNPFFLLYAILLNKLSRSSEYDRDDLSEYPG